MTKSILFICWVISSPIKIPMGPIFNSAVSPGSVSVGGAPAIYTFTSPPAEPTQLKRMRQFCYLESPPRYSGS